MSHAARILCGQTCTRAKQSEIYERTPASSRLIFLYLQQDELILRCTLVLTSTLKKGLRA